MSRASPVIGKKVPPNLWKERVITRSLNQNACCRVTNACAGGQRLPHLFNAVAVVYIDINVKHTSVIPAQERRLIQKEGEG